jgi:hypothetical protein
MYAARRASHENGLLDFSPLCLRMNDDESLWRAYRPLDIVRHVLRVFMLDTTELKFSLGDEGSEGKDKHPGGGSGELDAAGAECRPLRMILPLLFLEIAHLAEHGVTAACPHLSFTTSLCTPQSHSHTCCLGAVAAKYRKNLTPLKAAYYNLITILSNSKF